MCAIRCPGSARPEGCRVGATDRPSRLTCPSDVVRDGRASSTNHSGSASSSGLFLTTVSVREPFSGKCESELDLTYSLHCLACRNLEYRRRRHQRRPS